MSQTRPGRSWGAAWGLHVPACRPSALGSGLRSHNPISFTKRVTPLRRKGLRMLGGVCVPKAQAPR